MLDGITPQQAFNFIAWQRRRPDLPSGVRSGGFFVLFTPIKGWFGWIDFGA